MTQSNNYFVTGNGIPHITADIFEDDVIETEYNVSINQELANHIANALQTELYNAIKQQNSPGYQNVLNELYTLVSNITEKGLSQNANNPFERAVFVLVNLLTNEDEVSIRAFLRYGIAKVLKNHEFFKTNTSEFYTEEITDDLIREYKLSAIKQKTAEDQIIHEVVTAQRDESMTFAVNPTTKNQPKVSDTLRNALIKQQGTIKSQLMQYNGEFTQKTVSYTRLQEINDHLNYVIKYNQEGTYQKGEKLLIAPYISNDQIQSLNHNLKEFNPDLVADVIKIQGDGKKTPLNNLNKLKNLIDSQLNDFITNEPSLITLIAQQESRLQSHQIKMTSKGLDDYKVSVGTIHRAVINTLVKKTAHDANQEFINMYKVKTDFETTTRIIYSIISAKQEFQLVNPNNTSIDIKNKFSAVQNKILQQSSIDITQPINMSTALNTLTTKINQFKTEAKSQISSLSVANIKKDLLINYITKLEGIRSDKNTETTDYLNKIKTTNAIYAPVLAIKQQIEGEKSKNLKLSKKITGLTEQNFSFIRNSFEDSAESIIENITKTNDDASFSIAKNELMQEKSNLEFNYNQSYLYELQLEESMTSVNTLLTDLQFDDAKIAIIPSAKASFKQKLADEAEILLKTKEIIILNNNYQKLNGLLLSLNNPNLSFNLSMIDLETLNILKTINIISGRYFTKGDDEKIISENEESPKKDSFTDDNSAFNATKSNSLKTKISGQVNNINQQLTEKINLVNLKNNNIKQSIHKNILSILLEKFTILNDNKDQVEMNINNSLETIGEIQYALDEIQKAGSCIGKLYIYAQNSKKPLNIKHHLGSMLTPWLKQQFSNDIKSIEKIENKDQLEKSIQTVSSYKNSWIVKINQIYNTLVTIQSNYQSYENFDEKAKKEENTIEKIQVSGLTLSPVIVTEKIYEADKADYTVYAIQKNELMVKKKLLKFIDYLILESSELVGNNADKEIVLNIEEFSIELVYLAHKNLNINTSNNFFFKPQDNLKDFELFAKSIIDNKFNVTSNKFDKDELKKLIQWLRSDKDKISTNITNKIQTIENKRIMGRAFRADVRLTDDHINTNINDRTRTVEKIHKLQLIRWKVLELINVLTEENNTDYFSRASIAVSLNASFTVEMVNKKERDWIEEFIDSTIVESLDDLTVIGELKAFKDELNNLWEQWLQQQKEMETDVNKQIVDDLKKQDDVIKTQNIKIEINLDKELGYSSLEQHADRSSFKLYESAKKNKLRTSMLNLLNNWINEVIKNKNKNDVVTIDKSLITIDMIKSLTFKDEKDNKQSVLSHGGLEDISFLKTPTKMQDGSRANINNLERYNRERKGIAKDFYFVVVNLLQDLPSSSKYEIEGAQWTVGNLGNLQKAIRLKLGVFWKKEKEQINQLRKHSDFLQPDLKVKAYETEYEHYYKQIMIYIEETKNIDAHVSVLEEVKIKLFNYHRINKKHSSNTSKIVMLEPPISVKLANAASSTIKQILDPDDSKNTLGIIDAELKKIAGIGLKKTEPKESLKIDSARFETVYKSNFNALNKATKLFDDKTVELKNDINRLYVLTKTLIKENPIKYSYGIIALTGAKIVTASFEHRRLTDEIRREEHKSFVDKHVLFQKMLSDFASVINITVNSFFIAPDGTTNYDYTTALDKSTNKRPVPVEMLLKKIKDPRVINILTGFVIKNSSGDKKNNEKIYILQNNQRLFKIPEKMVDDKPISDAIKKQLYGDEGYKSNTNYDYNFMHYNLTHPDNPLDLKGEHYNRAQFKEMLSNVLLLQKVLTNKSQAESVRLQDSELDLVNGLEALVEFNKAYKRLCDLIIANAVL